MKLFIKVLIPIVALTMIASSAFSSTDPKVVVGFVTQSVMVQCKSRHPPAWNWLGKKAGEIRNLANGVTKHVRFDDSRYMHLGFFETI